MKLQTMGFQQALEYLLGVLCYAYYVKHDTLVSDQLFDELEKFYCKLFKVDYSIYRGAESEGVYTTGIKVVYDFIKGIK
jgi:hypothetical protein